MYLIYEINLKSRIINLAYLNILSIISCIYIYSYLIKFKNILLSLICFMIILINHIYF